MQAFFRGAEGANVGEPIIANNSAQFTKGDPVTIDANGNLIVSTAGDKVLGYALEDVTVDSDNETVAKYCPQYLEAEGVEMAFTADQAATQTDIGAYADLTGTTGAIQMNLAAGATGQFIVLKIDPYNTGDTDVVAVKVAEPQVLAFAQS